MEISREYYSKKHFLKNEDSIILSGINDYVAWFLCFTGHCCEPFTLENCHLFYRDEDGDFHAYKDSYGSNAFGLSSEKNIEQIMSRQAQAKIEEAGFSNKKEYIDTIIF